MLFASLLASFAALVAANHPFVPYPEAPHILPAASVVSCPRMNSTTPVTFIADANSCTAFFICDKTAVPVKFVCPPGLVWRQSLSRCDIEKEGEECLRGRDVKERDTVEEKKADQAGLDQVGGLHRNQAGLDQVGGLNRD
ncbi:hypothetical protein FPQ18DRAFT_343623 [Pyronema domesticum]|uniref:Chitin-binding type-2 domain-containing protein n=1 Tax=Pyronema omphalodes (strain CBS 100304) TaxID=1076935 RepID=U4KX84_PYROM|nr:hypothetical protein FPQ18DRAFT_343623 [Pyronema domesticum]CCX06396.1 Similar to hypothetical protein AND_22662 [Anopheles darlingi]; acc. no. EFR19355 [Pyronema omphalodes CBS 100304]